KKSRIKALCILQSAFLSKDFLVCDRNRKRIKLLISVLNTMIRILSLVGAGGTVNWLKNLLGINKTIEQRLKANYTYYASLNLTLEREWQQEENFVLLLLEETGVGG